MNNLTNGICKKRYFTVVNKETNEHIGRYYGKTLKIAAYKACVRLIKDKRWNKVQDGIVFCMKELNQSEPNEYIFWGNITTDKISYVVNETTFDVPKYIVHQLN